MEFPKTTSELAIWLGVQFPVVASSILLAYWAVRFTERLQNKRFEGAEEQHAALLGEKEKRIEERDKRIQQLEAEVAELRAKLSRSKKSPDEPKPGTEGDKP